jgi:cell division protein FtsQ
MSSEDRPKSPRPKSPRPKPDRARADGPKTPRPKADRPKTDRTRADGPKAPRPKAPRPKTDRPKTDRANAGRAKDGAPIDPRIRARRDEVAREGLRIRWRRLIVVAVVLAVVAGLFGLTRTPLLDLDHVRVTGTAHLSVDTVVAASALRRGEPMLGVGTSAASRRVAALPWVESVSVSRSWPGTVRIKVVERQAVAVLAGPRNTWALVDRNAMVLERVDTSPADLPRIDPSGELVDPGVVQPNLSYGVTVARSLTPDLRAWVVMVQPQPDGTVNVALQAGMSVILGTEAHLQDKMVDLASVLTGVQLACIDKIDLRVPHASVVTRTNGCG